MGLGFLNRILSKKINSLAKYGTYWGKIYNYNSSFRVGAWYILDENNNYISGIVSFLNADDFSLVKEIEVSNLTSRTTVELPVNKEYLIYLRVEGQSVPSLQKFYNWDYWAKVLEINMDNFPTFFYVNTIANNDGLNYKLNLIAANKSGLYLKFYKAFFINWDFADYSKFANTFYFLRIYGEGTYYLNNGEILNLENLKFVQGQANEGVDITVDVSVNGMQAFINNLENMPINWFVIYQKENTNYEYIFPKNFTVKYFEINANRLYFQENETFNSFASRSVNGVFIAEDLNNISTSRLNLKNHTSANYNNCTGINAGYVVINTVSYDFEFNLNYFPNVTNIQNYRGKAKWVGKAPSILTNYREYLGGFEGVVDFSQSDLQYLYIQNSYSKAWNIKNGKNNQITFDGVGHIYYEDACILVDDVNLEVWANASWRAGDCLCDNESTFNQCLTDNGII